ncbi:MAG: hypothetical protein QGH60_17445 [Phycisphaerae bacterium]|jgi:hypothetical protein|nr:hypothetical protein [Phycisphaerae bacterium]
MITTPTVLILGAGASAHLDFPTGPSLSNAIFGAANNPPDFLINAIDNLLSPNELKDFANRLRTSSAPSIDSFLQRNTHFIPITKLLIALCLIPYEKPALLWASPHPNADWYKLLFNTMQHNAPDLRDFANNRLSILTYNYDRSLDHFLHHTLMSRYNADSASCESALRQIPIVHLHGQLAELHDRPYSPTLNPDTILKSADAINVVYEPIDAYPQFTQAREMLSTAARIYFLGFGYDPVNVNRLNLQEIDTLRPKYLQRLTPPATPQPIIGTLIGFNDHETATLKKQYSSVIGFVENFIMDFLSNRHTALI